MKNLIVTLLAVVTLTTGAYCQKSFILSYQDKKAFLALSSGISLPVGRFASCSPVDQQAGMAGRGLAINVSAGYRLVGHVGLMIRGERHQNVLQTHALLDALYRTETDVWIARADKWSVTTLMGGPYVNFPMGRFSVDARLLAGRAMATLPGTAMTGNFGRVEMSVKTTGSQSAALAVGGGLALRYRLGRSFSAHVNADYTRSELMFNNLTSTAWSSNGRSESQNFSSSRVVSVVSVSAGIAVLFGNGYHPF